MKHEVDSASIGGRFHTAWSEMRPQDVDLSKLAPPSSRGVADPLKLVRHGHFDWNKYTPIIVEQDGQRFVIQDGLTRVENARRAGIKKLPAYVFRKR